MRERRSILISVAILCFALMGLSGCGDPIERDIARLIEGGEAAEDARMRLTLAKGPAIEPLIRAFQDRNNPSRARVVIAQALFALYLRETDKRILETLIEGLDDEDAAVRHKVATKLGDLRKREGTGPMIERLGREGEDDVRLEILLALEIMGMESAGGGFFNADINTDKMTEEEKESFTQLLVQMNREELPDSLLMKTREWLEILAEEVTIEARNLELKADLQGAEAILQEARGLIPDSKNVNQKLGRFYYNNGEEKKGLEILTEFGMVVHVRKLKQRPRIDGVFDEPAWSDVEPLTQFFQCIYKMRAYPIEGETEAYVGYFGNELFIGIKGYESSTDNLTAQATQRDANAWQDDCIEIFLDINQDYVSFYQIVINSLGTIFDDHSDGTSPQGDVRWNGEYDTAIKKDETFWTVELGIPVDQFKKKIKAGDIWGFNVARIRIANAAEYGQWVPTYGRARRPDRFGFLVFE